MTLSEFWPQCLLLLSKRLPAQQFDTWVAPLTVGEEGGVWVVFAKNQFACNMLKNRYAEMIDGVRAELAPQQAVLQFKVGVGQHFQPLSERELPESSQSVSSVSGGISTDIAEKERVVQTVQPTAKVKSAQRVTREILEKRLAKAASGSPSSQLSVASESSEKNDKPGNVRRVSKNVHVPDSDAEKSTLDELRKQSNLSHELTFETLVEGKGNQLAVAAARSIAENPGAKYNPLFLYGSTGLGKTHLVQSVGNELLRLNPKAKVCYIHSNDYIRSLMNAFRTNNYELFKQQYKQYDLLIIDDIQFIKGKERTMEEFFYLYNHFHTKKKQLILTCDVLPAQLENMDDRLKSRFSWGLTLELEPPELEMRVAILQKKAEAAGVDLDAEAAFFIAKHIRANVRELEGAFKRVEARSRFLKKEIDINLATEALQDIIVSTYKVITAELIMEQVAKYYRIKITDILGKNRSRGIARPRQMAMCLTKELTSLSLPAIGEAFGGRDHTTVMHGVKTITALRTEDPELAQDYEKLMILIQN